MDRVLACPRCPGSQLDVVAHDRHEIDLCPSCRGAWLDAAEWGAVIGPAASPTRLAEIRGVVPAADAPACPACPAPPGAPACKLQPRMIVGAEDVVLDACPSCRGAWLDGGEIASLKRSLAATRARTPAPPPLPRSGGAAPSDGPGAMTMGAAMASTALSALVALASQPPRRRGFFGRRRRRRSGVPALDLIQMLLGLLRLFRR